ncbi:hypothetical protein L1049_000950 [Liquidambar formosana]|uniref:RRM domain-containing protein n=1 Tax=Liquidambar formosana TaxID=63359 RepID=A0AAP0NBY5_LIQFO
MDNRRRRASGGYGQSEKLHLASKVNRGRNFFGRYNSCVSLFVGNLPERLESRWLRNLFKWYGEIVDVYIPRRRRSGFTSSYGFVRFRNEKDANLAIQKCNGAWRWSKKLLVKRAAYEKDSKVPPHHRRVSKRQVWRRKSQPSASETHIQVYKSNRDRTYAEVVAGIKPNMAKDELIPEHTVKHQSNVLETILAVEVDDSWLKRRAFGTVHHVSCLQSLQETFL